jgi:hypothetical protein|tara:strand:+ start:42 stop:503 length:462 start_codon:yes stop_codon:yes gene_type:complete
MTIDKTPRSASTRKSESRVKEWQLPSTLDTPDAPEGYKFRWIRQSVRGYEDNKNVIGRIRQGYELVRADEFPDFDFPTEAEGKHKGIVSVGGLLLAKVPLEIAKQRNDYYKKISQDQQDAVDNDLFKDEHPSMPLHRPERKTKVTFGGSSKDE